MQIIKYKWWFLIFSALVLIPGIIGLSIWKLKLSIDFTGGSLIKYQFPSGINKDEIVRALADKNIKVENIQEDLDNVAEIKTQPLEAAKIDEIKSVFSSKYPDSSFKSFETVGPVIGSETTKDAFVSLAWASFGILVYIAYAFRNIPKPYSSLRFGVAAIIAMLHDALVVIGIFSILGHYFGIEIDMLFITAMLTVIGFSVHDTIVVFDRVRENLNKLPRSLSFEEVVNFSLVETLNRSIATSLTVIITLLSLYILGGQSIRNFVLAMLIGIVSGTYSSIFTASPIIVIWENFIHEKMARSSTSN